MFVGKMVEMGYGRDDVETALRTRAYDDSFATYLLLGAKTSEVGIKLIVKS